MSTKISAIVVNYGAAQLVRRAIESIVAGRERCGKTEIIVVDNTADTDERRRIRNLVKKDATLIFNEKNEGFAAGCNRAYAVSKGEQILLLNPDAYLLTNALFTLSQFLDQSHTAGAVAPITYWDDGRRFFLPPSVNFSPSGDVMNIVVESSRWLTSLRSRLWRRKALTVLRSVKPIRQRVLSGGVVLIRREAIERSGGLFDARFFMYFEDTDLFARIRKCGFELYIEPNAQAIHNYDQCGASEKPQKQRYMKEAYALYIEKHDQNGTMRGLGNRLRRWLPVAQPFVVKKLGTLRTPFKVSVPERLRAGWVLEWSPNANLIPAAVRFGSGDIADIPPPAWALLKPGRYFARLGSPSCVGRFETWAWAVE